MSNSSDDCSDGTALTFDQLVALNTGSSIDPAIWHAGQKRNAILQNQTDDLANKLESQGVIVRSNNVSTAIVGEITGCVDVPPNYRRIRFLPIVAAKERAPMLNNLKGFLRTFSHAAYLRYVVITAGERIPVYGPLRDTITKFQRRISKWASETTRRYGIAVVFRGTEFTIDAELTFHVHANILIAPLRKLPEDEWSSFLKWCWKFFGTHMQDNGRLQKPDEVVKYSFKPLESSRLDAPMTCWLKEAIQRLKLIQPLGAFADYCRVLEINGEKHAYIQTAQGKTLARVKKQSRPKNDDLSKSLSTDSGPPLENQIIGRTAPHARFTPFAEPCVLVNNYTPNPTTEAGKLNLWKIRQASLNTRELWNANGAPSPEEAKAIAKAKTDKEGC